MSPTFLISAARDLPHLGWDPTPGDPPATRETAAHLRALASHLDTLATDLESTSAHRAWRGRTADAFCQAAAALPQGIRTAATAFEEVAHTLTQWAHVLEDFQTQAAHLDAAVADATAEIAHRRAVAEAAIARTEAEFRHRTPTDALTPTAGGWATGATTPTGLLNTPDHTTDPTIHALNAALEHLQELQRRAEDLHRRYTDEATALARHINHASATAPLDPTFHHQISHWFTENWDTWDDGFGRNVRQYSHGLDFATDTAGGIGIASGFLAFVPPLTAIAGSIASSGGLLSFAGNVLLAAHADGSWTDAGLDAAGLGLGFTASRLSARLVKSYRDTGRASQLVRIRSLSGKELQIPPGLFSAKTSEGKEGLVRLARLKVSQTGLALTGIQARSLAHEYALTPKSTSPWDQDGYPGTAFIDLGDGTRND